MLAVLRGGSRDFKQSLSDGAEVLSSLKKIGYEPMDVIIDSEGNWTRRGVPTDAHYIFTRAHTVVDTTRMKGQAYQRLAKQMDVPLLFSAGDDMHADREDMYRILRMQGISVPDTEVIRAKAPLQPQHLKNIWTTYHTPLMLRPLVTPAAPSKLIKGFHDFHDVVHNLHQKGVDVHVMTYRDTPTSSVAVIPDFRGQRLYTPLWVDTFTEKGGLPNHESRVRAHTHAPEQKKEEIRDFVTRVYDALNLSGPVCIDIVSTPNGYMVVNVETSPSLRSDGRFMQSLATTGVDAGQYIHSHIQNEYTR
jgi:D-alanine-D-alanine ligase-like ATP-grasp enzyme